MANPFNKPEDNNNSDWVSNPELNPGADSATSVQGDTTWRDAKLPEDAENKPEETPENIENKHQPAVSKN